MMRLSLITTLALLRAYSVGFALEPGMIGRPAPAFTLKTVDGVGSLSLADLRDNVVIIDFWATWCAPCQRSLPRLSTFASKMPGVKVVAVNIDDERQNALEFLRKNKLKLTSVYDEMKRTVEHYDVSAMPSAFVVDKHGVVRFVHAGYNEKEIDLITNEARGLAEGRIR